MANNFFKKLIANQLFFGFIIFLSIYLKIYRAFFYARFILEFLPLYNGYKWPISLIYFLTSPMLRFYKSFLPSFFFSYLTIDPTLFLSIEIFTTLIEFVDDAKDIYAESIFF